MPEFHLMEQNRQLGSLKTAATLRHNTITLKIPCVIPTAQTNQPEEIYVSPTVLWVKRNCNIEMNNMRQSITLQVQKEQHL